MVRAPTRSPKVAPVTSQTCSEQDQVNKREMRAHVIALDNLVCDTAGPNRDGKDVLLRYTANNGACKYVALIQDRELEEVYIKDDVNAHEVATTRLHETLMANALLDLEKVKHGDTAEVVLKYDRRITVLESQCAEDSRQLAELRSQTKEQKKELARNQQRLTQYEKETRGLRKEVSQHASASSRNDKLVKQRDSKISQLSEELAMKCECKICLQDAQPVVLVPCGHTACIDCGTLLNACHICRAPIDQKIKLFL